MQHGNRALDIGCGIGDLASVLLTKFRAVYGTEISTEAIRIGKLLYPRVNFSLARGIELPFPDSFFDLVTSNQVVEHMYPDETDMFFREVYRVLAFGGQCIVSTPNGSEIRRRVLWFPIRFISRLLNKPETYVGAKLYFIQNKLLSRGTAKASLFLKYQMLEHINVLRYYKIRLCAEASGLHIKETIWDGFTIMFPKLLCRFRRLFELLESRLRNPTVRSLLMRDMTVILEKRRPISRA